MPIAAMVGSTSPRTSDHICTETGRTVGELKKIDTTSSSNEITMANSSPESTAGRINGKVTRQKARQRVAPSVMAAFSSWSSTRRNAASTVNTT